MIHYLTVILYEHLYDKIIDCYKKTYIGLTYPDTSPKLLVRYGIMKTLELNYKK
jgi:hypothetical protein